MNEYVFKISKQDLKQKGVYDCLNNRLVEYRDNLFIGGRVRLDNKEEIISDERLKADLDNISIVEALYKKHGSNFIERVYGSYSFIIHDFDAGKIFYFRDHFGQSSAFYASLKNDVFFSSKIENIFQYTSLKRTMNITRVIDFIAHTHSCSNETFFKEVFSLSPSCLLTLKSNLIEISKYYEFRFKTIESDNTNTQKIFFNAVREVMDSKTSTMLSGGLDSSSITAAVSNLNSERNTKSFSIVFPNLRGSASTTADEKQYIDAAVEFLNVDSYQIPIKNFDFVASIKANIKFLDEPVMATNTYIYEEIFKEMNKQGCKRVLDGTDGDSVVSHGTEIFRQLGEEMKISELLNQKKIMIKNTILSIAPLGQYIILVSNINCQSFY